MALRPVNPESKQTRDIAQPFVEYSSLNKGMLIKTIAALQKSHPFATRAG
jgi:hypothetical protein